jgi:hypothetical protein
MSLPTASPETATTERDIRPFHVSVPEEDLVDVRRRIAATRRPEHETVADQSQGVQLATTQKLAQFWGTDYDMHRFAARPNFLPQFMTDGLAIHFIHVRAEHEDALPLIITITHGWPAR